VAQPRFTEILPGPSSCVRRQVVLHPAAGDAGLLARRPGDRRGAGVCLQPASVGEPLSVVPDLGKHPGAELGAEAGEAEDDLSVRVQAAITPAREGLPERRFGGRTFRIGDKVTQIRNNYEKGQNGVFNGTVGVVTTLSTEEQKLTVLTDENEEIDYDFDELDELAHAYAVTIHRSQGCEYPAVVIPLTTSAWTMLQRNLLYTAVTRAKQLVVLVGSRKALGQAVRTITAGRRHTALDHRLTPA
jgi:hypothetical protein